MAVSVNCWFGDANGWDVPRSFNRMDYNGHGGYMVGFNDIFTGDFEQANANHQVFDSNNSNNGVEYLENLNGAESTYSNQDYNQGQHQEYNQDGSVHADSSTRSDFVVNTVGNDEHDSGVEMLSTQELPDHDDSVQVRSYHDDGVHSDGGHVSIDVGHSGGGAGGDGGHVGKEEHQISEVHYHHKHAPHVDYKDAPIKVPKPILVAVAKPYPFPVKQVKTIVETKEEQITIPVEKPVPVKIVKTIPFKVDKPVPYKVVKYIKVYVPKPYPVKVPVYKTIVHKVKGHK